MSLPSPGPEDVAEALHAGRAPSELSGSELSGSELSGSDAPAGSQARPDAGTGDRTDDGHVEDAGAS